MIRLTLILAVAIFAVLVLVPQQVDVTEGGPGLAGPSGAEAPASRTDRGTGAGDALREGADGRLVLRTATGEDLPIDLIVEPSELAAAEPGAVPATVGTPETPPPASAGAQPAASDAPTGVTRLRVTGDRVNFRAGPSTEDEILAALTLGTEVELIERVADGWAHLRVPATGLTGYMSGDFLEPAN